MLKQFLPVLHVLWLAVVAFCIHELVFYVSGFNLKASVFHYSLFSVYGFFVLCSVTIISILVFISRKTIDNTGYAFLFLTCAKMAAAYAFLYPVLQESGKYMREEKLNFFIVFAFFLMMETMLSIRILNRK